MTPDLRDQSRDIRSSIGMLLIALVALGSVIAIILATKERVTPATPALIVSDTLPVRRGNVLSAIDTIGVTGGTALPASASAQMHFKLGSVLNVEGWCFQDGSDEDRGVVIVVDGEHVVPAHQRLQRPDVAAVYPQQRAAPGSGFVAQLPTASIGAGHHHLTVGTVEPDGQAIITGSADIAIDVRR